MIVQHQYLNHHVALLNVIARHNRRLMKCNRRIMRKRNEGSSLDDNDNPLDTDRSQRARHRQTNRARLPRTDNSLLEAQDNNSAGKLVRIYSGTARDPSTTKVSCWCCILARRAPAWYPALRCATGSYDANDRYANDGCVKTHVSAMTRSRQCQIMECAVGVNAVISYLDVKRFARWQRVIYR
jgi:hypothetical protein